jgi:hypothetical protein
MLPVSFWVVICLIIGGGIWAFGRARDGTGLPLLAVLGTATSWYVGDVFYNDYPNTYAKAFDAETLSGAWWQVAWFLTVLLVAAPLIHQWLNHSFQNRRSGVLRMFKRGVEVPELQKSLSVLFRGCASVWMALFVIALIVLKSQILFFLFPFLGYHASPWSHGQIGAGFDCFSILAVYLQLLVASMFGVVAALATNRSLRRQAILLCLLAWPYFIFDRTRNSILAIVIPAVLSWVFLRLRGGLWKKAVILLACFMAVNFWMKFIIANRSQTSITAAFQQKGLGLADQKKVHNEGLNMYEELCWVSTFIDNGRYHVNWGRRYFAELVNPIPRGLWHNKPLIGLDYAIARGHHITGPNGTVDTTISTGFIGQGVVNFGRFLGPMAAALLMSLWVAVLARLDLNIHALGRLPLYSLGLILTFNLGRDITLITLYPFLFGALAVWWLERHSRVAVSATPQSAAGNQSSPPRQPGGRAREDRSLVRPAEVASRSVSPMRVSRRPLMAFWRANRPTMSSRK